MGCGIVEIDLARGHSRGRAGRGVRAPPAGPKIRPSPDGHPLWALPFTGGRSPWVFAGLFAALLSAFLSWPVATRGQVQPEAPLWRFVGGDVRVREVLHRRETSPSGGHTTEHIVIEAGPGTVAYYVLPVAPAPVIRELQVRIPVWADRPGLQVFLSVVLPRVRHPQTEAPLSLLVPGNQIRVAGQWEWLAVGDVPTGLEREARALRLQLRRDVDLREAYIDGVVLNLYGGPGTTRVMIGPAEWSGYLPRQVPVGTTGEGPPIGQPAAQTPPPFPPPPGQPSPAWLNSPAPGAAAATWTEPDATATGESVPLVEMAGAVLRVRGRPFFPRALEYHGEPLELVSRLGFNTLWIRGPIDRRFLPEARRYGLWLIVRPDELFLTDPGSGTGRTIGAEYDGVLAWDLGIQSTPWEVDELHHRVELLRSLDPTPTRPILAEPLTNLLKASRAVDALLAGRPACFAELELPAYAAWLRSRPLLARPGTPLWVTVQTQPDALLFQQWQTAGASADYLDCVPPEQIRLLTYLSLTAGARALLFHSRSSLAQEDPATQQRRLALELMNRELEWIEPFLAGGQFLTLVSSNVPEVVGALFHAERARLLVPLWLGRGAQFVPGQAAAEEVTFVVPGVPESNTAYLLLPGALEPLNTQRVAGGMRITLREFGPTSLVAITQDPVVLAYLMERAKTAGPRIVQLERQLAEITFRNVQAVHAQLIRSGPFIPQAESWFRLAAEELASADRATSVGDEAAAFRHIHRALRPLLLIRRIDWESAIPSQESVVTWPLATSFDTLPWLATWQERLGSADWSTNQLATGDFEAPEAITASGWEPFQYPVDGVIARVDVTPSAARSGQMGLLLSARPLQAEQEKAMVESPPLWIRSPAVSVQPGDWVRIEGWVFIPRRITGSVDGLMIVDSLGGDALALRISETEGWRRFRMFRRATGETAVRVTFVLTGLGEACLDDVSVHVFSPTHEPAEGNLAGR